MVVRTLKDINANQRLIRLLVDPSAAPRPGTSPEPRFTAVLLNHPRKGNIAVTEKAEAKKTRRFNRLHLTGWALHLYRDIEILMPIICLRSNGNMPVVEKLDWDHFKSRSLC
jgi:hypothetical protein